MSGQAEGTAVAEQQPETGPSELADAQPSAEPTMSENIGTIAGMLAERGPAHVEAFLDAMRTVAQERADALSEVEAAESAEPDADQDDGDGTDGDFYEVAIEGWNGTGYTGSMVPIGKVCGNANTGKLLKERLSEVVAAFARRYADAMENNGVYNDREAFDEVLGNDERARNMRRMRQVLDEMNAETLANCARTFRAGNLRHVARRAVDAIEATEAAGSDTRTRAMRRLWNLMEGWNDDMLVKAADELEAMRKAHVVEREAESATPEPATT